jgi:hypothetical protein
MQGQRGGGGQANLAGRTLGEQIRDVRIVKAGLLGGLVAFAGVIAMVAPITTMDGRPAEIPLLMVLGALVVANVVGQVVFHRRYIADLRRMAPALKREADPLVAALPTYRSHMIISSGLVQGTGLLACIIIMMFASPLAMAVLAGAVVWHLLTFPMEGSIRRTVQNAIETA